MSSLKVSNANQVNLSEQAKALSTSTQELKRQLGLLDKWGANAHQSKRAGEVLQDVVDSEMEARRRTMQTAIAIAEKQATAALVVNGINNFTPLLAQLNNRAALAGDAVVNATMAAMLSHVENRDQQLGLINEKCQQGVLSAEEGDTFKQIAYSMANDNIVRANARRSQSMDVLDELHLSGLMGIEDAKNTLMKIR